ncbi:MAG: DUF2892 domain-containing protein [Limnohabitans sp.]|nr:DUF2892 domain-containing protein [Limnohabitans sp.]
MIKNIGKTDRIIRIILAIIIAGLDYFEVIKGSLGWLLSLIAVVLFVTAIIERCPLYKILGKSTCEVK